MTRPRCSASIDKVVETGLDPRRFVEDLLERLRDLIVVAAVTDGAGSVLRDVPEDQLERMRRQAAAFGPGALSRAADVVNAGLTEMTGATAPRLQLELIAARILLPGAAGEAGYAARLDRLERRLDVGGVPTAAVSYAAPVAARCRPAGSRHLPSPRPSRRRPLHRRRPPAAAPARRPEREPRPPMTCARPTTRGAPRGDGTGLRPAGRRRPRRPAHPAGRHGAGRRHGGPPEPAAVAHPRGPGGLDTDALRRSGPTCSSG